MLRSALLLVTTLLGLWRGGVQGYSDGPPLDRFPELCASMTPGLKAHRSGPSNSTFPFEVSFAQTCFEAGGQVEVTVAGKNNVAFKGVFLQARKASSPDTATPYGTFNAGTSGRLKTVNCDGNNNAITHSSSVDKTTETVTWTAPDANTLAENVVFRVSVVQERATYWIKQDSAALTYSATCSGDSGSGSPAWTVPLSLSLLTVVAAAAVVKAFL